jgi:hypothetical protein
VPCLRKPKPTKGCSADGRRGRRRTYWVAWVAKFQGPRAGGGSLGPPASELKTLKIFLYADFNYLKIFIFGFLI